MCESPKCRTRTFRACYVSRECKENRKESMGWGDILSGAHHRAAPRTAKVKTGAKIISRISSRCRKNLGIRDRNPTNILIQCTSVALGVSPSPL